MKTYIVKFKSGDTTELDSDEYNRLMSKFNKAGRHFPMFLRQSGEMFFLENVERIIPQGEDDVVVVEEPTVESETVKVEDTQTKALDKLIELSNCKHEVEQVLYKQETKTGPRYFRLCSFCGGNRTRFIALKDMTDEEMKNAKEWVDEG